MVSFLDDDIHRYDEWHCGQYLHRTRRLVMILVIADVHQFIALIKDLIQRLLGGLCFLGMYGDAPPESEDSRMRVKKRTVMRQKTASDMRTSSGSTNHKRLFVIANQSQEST